jgi:Winged helix DNA-binding domain
VTDQNEPPYVDAQSLSDVETYIYEAIATLEYRGRPATESEIAAVVDLDDQTVSEVLATLTERGLLVSLPGEGELAFQPARRDWSAAPDWPGRPEVLSAVLAVAGSGRLPGLFARFRAGG